MLANTNWHQELRNMKTHEQTARYIPVLTEKMTKAGAMTSVPRGKAKPLRPLKRLLKRLLKVSILVNLVSQWHFVRLVNLLLNFLS